MGLADIWTCTDIWRSRDMGAVWYWTLRTTRRLQFTIGKRRIALERTDGIGEVVCGQTDTVMNKDFGREKCDGLCIKTDHIEEVGVLESRRNKCEQKNGWIPGHACADKHFQIRRLSLFLDDWLTCTCCRLLSEWRARETGRSTPWHPMWPRWRWSVWPRPSWSRTDSSADQNSYE